MNNSIRIEENKYLVLPKLKRVKLKYHREIPKNYRIKSVTLINSNGNYYVSVVVQYICDKKEEKKKGFWYNVSRPKLHKEKPFYE